MKILFDDQIFLSQKFGGPSRYFIELNKNIRRIGEKSFVISPIYINNYLKNENDLSYRKYLFLKKKFKLNNIYKKINFFFIKNFIKKNSIDLLHPTYYDIQRYSKINIPKILTVYDLTHEKFPEYYGLEKNIKPKLNSLKFADHFVCPSNWTKKDLMEIYNIDENKISVVYWAPFLKNELVDIKKKDKPFLLYVGNRHKYKNAYKFLEAISKNTFIKSNFKIVFFGGGNFNSYEKKVLFNLGFKENQIELVIGSDKKLVELYQNATALVYPSKYEGLGLPILEAMQNKCPVIASKVSGMIEAGGNAVEYFDPYSLESILSAILNVINSESRREELVKLGIEHIKNFSWDYCAKQTLEIYKKLI